MAAPNTTLRLVIHLLKTAGAKTEDDYDRDGAFSYHAESHAAGMGISAGFIWASTGWATLLGVVYAAAVYGDATAVNKKRAYILRDIAEEPHYALGGVVVGVLLGMVVRLYAPELPLPDAPTPA